MPKRLEQFQHAALLLAVLLLSLGYVVVGLLFISAAVLWEGIATGSLPWRRGPLDPAFLMFAAAFLISGVLSAHTGMALGALALAVITIYLGYGLLYRLLWRDPRFVTPFLLTWFVGGVIAAAWASVSARLTAPPAELPELGRTALATALVIPFVLGLRWLDGSSIRGRVLAALGLAVVTSALLLTVARAAWLAAGAGLISYLALLRWQHSWRILATVFAVGVASVLVAGPNITLSERAGSIASLSTPTNKARLALADSALAIFRDHPMVGTGLNTFSRFHPSYPSRFFPTLFPHSSAHNIILNMAAEGGILGLGAFTWLVLAALGAGRHWYKTTPPRELALVSAVLAAFISLLVNQQFEASIVSVHLGTAFWFLIAVQVARAPQSVSSDQRVRTQASTSGCARLF